MKVSEAYPSNFLKADDLKGKRVKVTIDHVEMEEVGDHDQPVVYFKNREKKLPLNKTNAHMIEEIAKSDEMDEWSGVELVLYPARVDFQGKRVPAIRVDYVADSKPVAATVVDEADDLQF